MALLVHSSRKALEYLLHMSSLWAEIGEVHGEDLLREKDTRTEVTWCFMALCNAQKTWNELMKCPWTVACALHLLSGDPDARKRPADRRRACVAVESNDMAGAEDRDKGYILQVLNSDRANDRATRKKFASVFTAVDRISLRDSSVRGLLKGCFRLDSVMRQQNEAHAVIAAFTGCMADNQSDEKPVHIRFASDQGNHRIDKSDVIQIIREFWKEEALLDTHEGAQIGFGILSELADTPELLQHHLHMDLDAPKVHPECILAQHWIDNPQRIKQAFPVIGLSRYSCGTCKLFLQAVSKEALITGTKDVFCVCMVPEQSPPKVKEEVANQLLRKLCMQLGDFRLRYSLRKQLDAARENTR